MLHKNRKYWRMTGTPVLQCGDHVECVAQCACTALDVARSLGKSSNSHCLGHFLLPPYHQQWQWACMDRDPVEQWARSALAHTARVARANISHQQLAYRKFRTWAAMVTHRLGDRDKWLTAAMCDALQLARTSQHRSMKQWRQESLEEMHWALRQKAVYHMAVPPDEGRRSSTGSCGMGRLWRSSPASCMH